MKVLNDQTHTHSAGHSEMHSNTSAASKRVTDPTVACSVLTGPWGVRQDKSSAGVADKFAQLGCSR